MRVTKIIAENFKSFKHLELKLADFNVLIGANASGKSNFFQLFRFLRDIAKNGLEDAISMQGGVEYLRNLKIGSSENLKIEIHGNLDKDDIDKEFHIIDYPSKFTYSFALKFFNDNTDFEIIEDKLYAKEYNYDNYGDLTIIFDGLAKTDKDFLIFRSTEERALGISEDKYWTRKYKLGKTLLESTNPYIFINSNFQNISLYDIDTKLPKKAIPLSGKAKLEENGENLAIILKKIFENSDKKRKFLNLLNNLLPFVENVGINREYKNLILEIEENFFKDTSIPSSMLSDGTINVTALIIALYFEENAITLIEEPERNIHPHLISKLVEMMKEVSEKKQIIVSSHNPEILRNVDIGDLLLISRDRDGFSTITRAQDKKYLLDFLKNDIGIDELFVQNLLSD